MAVRHVQQATAVHFRGQTATDELEWQVLRAFYQATVGRTWIRLSDFDGVALDVRGRTGRIQLSGRRLRMHTGSIDWGALAGLRCLIVLDLSSNYLKGERDREFPLHYNNSRFLR